MKKRRITPLIPPFRGRWAKACLCVVFSATVAVGAHAQTQGDGDGGTMPPRDRNSELRTRTWSIYAQGGLSWATGVWYENLDAKRSYMQSPAFGGGVDYTIRPWVRVGAEYLWSGYRREQRFSALDAKAMPLKTYGNYRMNYHNAKLGADFNLMELWPRRGAQWLNIWAGTGLGYSFARGNEYGIYLSNTLTQGGTTIPLTDGASISNQDAVTITGNVRAQNRHEGFNTLYVPASLHIEADVSRQVTVGLKGEVDWLIDRKEIAPRNLVLALATVRYNFVPGRAKAQRSYYEREIASLRDRSTSLQREAAEAKAQADRAESARRQAEQQAADLQQRLADCEGRPTVQAVESRPPHFVQFDHNSSYMSREESERLKAFARSVKGQKLSLMAEASTPGTKDYNQSLSERRLQHVVDALVKEGFSRADLKPSIAIGSQNGKPDAEGRRVTITVEQNK